MAEIHRRPRSATAPEYLPPFELLRTIEPNARGRHKVLEKYDMPVTDMGVPDAVESLGMLGSILVYDPEYERYIYESLSDEGPRIANVDHLAYPRSQYEKFGISSYQNNYRRGTGLKIEMAIPFHNVATVARRDPEMPADFVMLARSNEQNKVKHLYRIAKTAQWLDSEELRGTQAFRTAADYVLRKGYAGDGRGRKQLPSFRTVLNELERFGPGTMGILPDLDHLSQLTLEEAIAELAVWGANDVIMTAEESTAIIFDASRRASGLGLAA